MARRIEGIWVCTEEDLKARLSPRELKKFKIWFNGQTGMLLENGELDYYLHDVDRFIRLYRNGTPTFWD